MHEQHAGHDVYMHLYCDTCEEVLQRAHGPAKITSPPKPRTQRELHRMILPDVLRAMFYCGVPFFFIGWQTSGGSFHAIAWAYWVYVALAALSFARDTFAPRSKS